MGAKKLQLILLYFACLFPVDMLFSQQTGTLYFVENSPLRHMYNPAFQPQEDFYVSLPLLGYLNGEIGNNSFKFNDLLYKQGDGMISFLNSDAGINRFYSTLKPNSTFYSGYQWNIISFGFKLSSSFFNFTYSERFLGSVNLPRNIVGISLYGTPSTGGTFDFSSLQAGLTAYSEAGFGYSTQLNEKISVGGKFKLLFGHANLSNVNRFFNLQAESTGWQFSGNGTAYVSSPVLLNFSADNRSFSYTTPQNLNDWYKPTGLGLGIDVGLIYHLNDKINFSASVLDIGFIRWRKNTVNLNYDIDYNFSGADQLNQNPNSTSLVDIYNQMANGNPLVDTLVTAFNSSLTSSRSLNNYSTSTSAKLNIGVEYNFHEMFGVGLLSQMQLYKNILQEDATLAFNVRPYSWLNGSLSYSLTNGTLSTFGLGLGVKASNVSFFFATDYISTQRLKFNPSDVDSSLPDWNFSVPYNSRAFNFAIGINLVFDYPSTTTNYRNKSSGSRYLDAGKSGFLHLLKGLHTYKSKNECRCDYN